MAYYDIPEGKGFAAVCNDVLRDKKLSLKAKAVFALMISFPPYPKYLITVAKLAKYCKETPDTITKAIKELETAGYVKRTQIRNSNGTLGYIYDISQEPIDKVVSAATSFDKTTPKKTLMEEPSLEKPALEKPVLVKPPVEKPVPVKPPAEKPILENTDIIKQNNNINKLKNKYMMNEDKEKRDNGTLDTNQSADEIVRLYHEICPTLNKIHKVTDERKKLIEPIVKEYSFEEIRTVFKKANDSKFLRGEVSDRFKADFEWLLDSTHFLRTLEGFYDNREPPKGQPSYDTNEIEQRTLNKYKNLDKTGPSYNLAEIEQQSYDLYKGL
ncbi:MAG: helix-turn-helix domain-containing protein [Ruminiclostridium sp.]|nr:helix-turn-helix domain-containing protein [Ruminiclostridium sp.]